MNAFRANRIKILQLSTLPCKIFVKKMSGVFTALQLIVI